MTTLEKYNKAFIEAFTIEESELATLSYQSVIAWDSIGHMVLMASLEVHFDIMLETEDIINFSSYEKGKDILKKYGIEI